MSAAGLTLGLDLGHRFAAVGYTDARRLPALVPDSLDNHSLRTPAKVHVTHDGILVGRPAEDVLEDDPAAAVVEAFAAHLGRTDVAHATADGDTWSGTGLTALLIRKLLADAHAVTARPASRLLLAAPADASEPTRRALLRAARLAGVSDARLVPAPFAAVLGAESISSNRPILVCDLGGAACRVAVVVVEQNRPRLLAAASMPEGGDGVDGRLIEQLAAILGRTERLTPDATTRRTLGRLIFPMKQTLCSGERVAFRPAVLEGRGVDLWLTRTHLAAAVAPLLARLEALVRGVIPQARVRELGAVLLVGGGATLPGVAELLGRVTGVAPHLAGRAIGGGELPAALAHAVGLARLAGMADSGADLSHWLLPEQSSPALSFEVATHVVDPADGQVRLQTLLTDAEPLPAEARTTLFTSREDQRRLLFSLALVEDGRAVAAPRFELGPIASPRRGVPVEVLVRCEADGSLRVSAVDRRTGQRLGVRAANPAAAETADAGRAFTTLCVNE